MVFRLGKIGVNTTFVVKKNNLKKLLDFSGIAGNFNNCQNDMNKQIDTNEQWLSLSKIIQNIPGKGIASLLGQVKETDIVVKVQLQDSAIQEYNFLAGDNSPLKDINGFIKYYCYFNCEGTKEYIESYSTMKEIKLCPHQRKADARGKPQGKGSSIGIIVMPYYKKGSIQDNIINLSKKDMKIILIKIINIYYEAFPR